LLQTAILLIVTSRVARITGVSQWCLAEIALLKVLKFDSLKKQKKLRNKIWRLGGQPKENA
jgi:hypothetical protein